MDPDETLRGIVESANAVLNDEADTYPDNLGSDATALAEGVQNLHTWLMGGGFLPAAWRASAGAGPIAGCDANGEPTDG